MCACKIKLDTFNPWLQPARNVFRPHTERAATGPPPPRRRRRRINTRRASRVGARRLRVAAARPPPPPPPPAVAMQLGLGEPVPYAPSAPWIARGLAPAALPATRIPLALLPTPLHRWRLGGLVPEGVELYIKRDDLTGAAELSGNKVRKLEFLLAEARAAGADCVVTLGGIQSNPARATAAAARIAGLDAHLVLRTSRARVDDDPGIAGERSSCFPDRSVETENNQTTNLTTHLTFS